MFDCQPSNLPFQCLQVSVLWSFVVVSLKVFFGKRKKQVASSSSLYECGQHCDSQNWAPCDEVVIKGSRPNTSFIN